MIMASPPTAAILSGIAWKLLTHCRLLSRLSVTHDCDSFAWHGCGSSEQEPIAQLQNGAKFTASFSLRIQDVAPRLRQKGNDGCLLVHQRPSASPTPLVTIRPRPPDLAGNTDSPGHVMPCSERRYSRRWAHHGISTTSVFLLDSLPFAALLAATHNLMLQSTFF